MPFYYLLLCIVFNEKLTIICIASLLYMKCPLCLIALIFSTFVFISFQKFKLWHTWVWLLYLIILKSHIWKKSFSLAILIMESLFNSLSIYNYFLHPFHLLLFKWGIANVLLKRQLTFSIISNLILRPVIFKFSDTFLEIQIYSSTISIYFPKFPINSLQLQFSTIPWIWVPLIIRTHLCYLPTNFCLLHLTFASSHV